MAPTARFGGTVYCPYSLVLSQVEVEVTIATTGQLRGATSQGLAVETLPAGTLLAIGPEAIIAITKGRTGCERLQAVQPMPTAKLSPIGALARVVMGGPIRVGDAVRVLEPAGEQAV